MFFRCDGSGLVVGHIRMNNCLELTPDMIVRPGHRVIASEVESRRARASCARASVKRIQSDPLRRRV